ncbi:hypothetical protein Hanom_Chr12g01160161 [Helianthus anomalus]
MDVFMFGLSDLNVLYANNIHVGAGNANLEEAMLFQRAVERAWERKRKAKRDSRGKEKGRCEELRKKKKADKKKDNSPAKPQEPSSIPFSAKQQPPTSFIYEATREDPPISSEAIVIQETPQATKN